MNRVKILEKEARGFIEKAIDGLIKTEITQSIRWLQDVLPIKSFEDLSLGWFIGSIGRFARDVIIMEAGEITAEDESEIQGILKRRLPEIMDKIERELHR